MLLKIEAKEGAKKVLPTTLKAVGLDERGFQAILFGSLDRLLREGELLTLTESRVGREEPDIMALDAEGALFIFELKAWESTRENLLQVLRYGQIFGRYDFDRLSALWRRSHPDAKGLAEAHQDRFGLELDAEDYNRKQVFVVMTNGLDAETRLSTQYWRSLGLDVRPWVYRVYQIEDNPYVEISAFATHDDPLEDQSESAREGLLHP